ncbi:hypothetical protein GWI33_016103 [Rhynchophorus ferrugineus]|uniref:Uncharacterized protein n=1 Tax=Rhynchophorus ferrugineus TaxID=354439 RepID=A0A834M3Q0_RHYFE|nr:hypothetical protein GWI33_016103 [Rhynchophorus ferrugineus]
MTTQSNPNRASMFFINHGTSYEKYFNKFANSELVLLRGPGGYGHVDRSRGHGREEEGGVELSLGRPH